MEFHLLLVSLLVIIPISSAIQTTIPLTISDNHEGKLKLSSQNIDLASCLSLLPALKKMNVLVSLKVWKLHCSKEQHQTEPIEPH